MSKGTLTINFIAGTHITAALKEAKKKAIALDMAYITFNFNGIDFSIGHDANLEKALVEFHNELISENPDSIVCG